ncbi:MAG: hypothetical protein AB2L07_02790 [Thermoanaerobaculaceae bacterium]
MTYQRVARGSSGARSRLLRCLVAAGWLLGGCVGWSQAQAPPQPTGLAAVHRSGQTFLTWTERTDLAGERYRVYRHTAPITSANLGAARRLLEVWEGSARFFADRWDDNGTWRARYLERFVIADSQPPLAEGTGLVVWTLAASDMGGSASGQGYYAVTAVNAAGVENTASFGAGNALGPVAESVADPLPVEASVPNNQGGHVFVQYYDLHTFNPTFYAPHQRNGFLGLSDNDPAVAHAVQYALTYSVGEPSARHVRGGPSRPGCRSCSTSTAGTATPTRPSPACRSTTASFEIRPVRRVGDVVLRLRPQPRLPLRRGARGRRHDRQLHRAAPCCARSTTCCVTPRSDRASTPNRVYVYGHSMGGSGTLALALRYAQRLRRRVRLRADDQLPHLGRRRRHRLARGRGLEVGLPARSTCR